MAQKIILQNRQALGDVVVLTALVRDIHLCHPGKFITRATTSFQAAVWTGNPNIITVPPPPRSVMLKCHYGVQMKEAKHGRKIHFIEGFIDYWNTTLVYCIYCFFGFVDLF